MISFLLNKFSEDKIPTINYASSSIVPYGNGNGDGNGNGNGIGNGNGNGIGNGIGNGNGIGIVSNNNLNLNGNLAQPISEEYILSQKETITRSYGELENILKRDNPELFYDEILFCYNKVELIVRILADNSDRLELIIPDDEARAEITKFFSAPPR